MITVYDFDFNFDTMDELIIGVTFCPEREAWGKANRAGVFHQWIEIKDECLVVMDEWMHDNDIDFQRTLFITSNDSRLIIDDIDSYVYMKLLFGGNDGTN